MEYSWKTLVATGLISGFIFVFLGCDDNNAVGSATGARVSLSTKYASSQASPKMGSSSLPGVSAVDSIEITRARFLLKEIELESVLGDSLEYEAGPLVVELDLSGSVNTIAVGDVPLGTYDEIEFEVHRIDSSDLEDQGLVNSPEFQDFMQGDRYSIIIDGTMFAPQGPTTFQFRSRVNEEQEYNLSPPLVLNTEGQVANVTLIISSANWFRAVNGSLLDPTKSSNENQISDNLKASIDPERDDDKDGEAD
ncbi:MAG: hypothetical protein ACE5PO_06940 [Candidatus Bathyarchaeia archaeon]